MLPADSHPVGQHKHILMIQLQAELQRRTGVWLPSVDLWDRIGEIFDIPRLESLVSVMSWGSKRRLY